MSDRPIPTVRRYWLNGGQPVPLAPGEDAPEGTPLLVWSVGTGCPAVLGWTPEQLMALWDAMCGPDDEPASNDGHPYVVPFWPSVERLRASGMALAPAFYTAMSIAVADLTIATELFPDSVTAADWPNDDADGGLEDLLGERLFDTAKLLRELVERYLTAEARRIINGTPRCARVPGGSTGGEPGANGTASVTPGKIAR